MVYFVFRTHDSSSQNIDWQVILLVGPLKNGHIGICISDIMADDIFKCIFLNESVWSPIKISLKFVPKGRINNIQTLVKIMAWRRPVDKPLSEPMMVSLPTHICVPQPQHFYVPATDCHLMSINNLIHFSYLHQFNHLRYVFDVAHFSCKMFLLLQLH